MCFFFFLCPFPAPLQQEASQESVTAEKTSNIFYFKFHVNLRNIQQQLVDNSVCVCVFQVKNSQPVQSKGEIIFVMVIFVVAVWFNLDIMDI